MEELEEKCPICQSVNLPGSCETCSHYLGIVFDSEMIWGKFGNEEGLAFNHSATILMQLYDSLDSGKQRIIRKVDAICDEAKIHPQLLGNGSTPAKIFESLARPSRGPNIEADGMASGSGYSLYHRDLQILGGLTAKLDALTERIRTAIVT